MTSLASLKLTTEHKPKVIPEPLRRRNKMLRRLAEQRELAVAKAEGKHCPPTRLRTVRIPVIGDKVMRAMPVRVIPWWWSGYEDETLLAIYYGSKMLEITPGKTSIVIGKMSELVAALDIMIGAVKAGDLDSQIKAASVSFGDGFRR